MLAKLLASYSLTPNDLKHCCGYTKDGTLPIVKTEELITVNRLTVTSNYFEHVRYTNTMTK